MEWKTVKLGEVANVQTGPFGSQLHNEDYVIKGTPIVTVEHLGARVFSTQNLPCVSDADKERLKKYTLKEGDVVFSRVGSVDRCSYVSSNEEGWLFSGRCLRVRTNEEVYPLFLYYYLQKEDVKQSIRNIAVGATMPSINTKLLSEIEVTYPSHKEQLSIAAILSSLDDKIENNNRINRNLEAQAQALFKSWFVDFEPWGGTMPDDWREGTLGEIAEFKRGKGILGKDARPGNVPVVAGGMEPAYYHDTANTKAPVITISASGANAGFVRLYYEDVWASDCSWIDASSKNLLWVYCYLSMNRHILRHAQTGAVQPHVKAKDVNAFEIIVPAQDVIEDFINAVKPLFKQIANNQEENQRLSSLRDTLLPKLMKGEIAL
jgi:type I restriction enzyme S subunit